MLQSLSSFTAVCCSVGILHTIENWRRSLPGELENFQLYLFSPILPTQSSPTWQVDGETGLERGISPICLFSWLLVFLVLIQKTEATPPLILVNFVWGACNTAKGQDIILIFCTNIAQYSRQALLPAYKIFYHFLCLVPACFHKDVHCDSPKWTEFQLGNMYPIENLGRFPCFSKM